MPGAATPASDRLRLGAQRLGWDHGEIPRWIAYDSAGRPRRRSMTETYLPRATDAGARLVVGRRVNRLVVERRAGEAVARSAIVSDGTSATSRIRVGAVVVCAGAIQTPALLQRSGLGRRLGATLAAHPTVKLAARFDDEVNVPDDVPVHQVSEFAPDLSFGGSASSPALVALSLSDHWSLFGDAVEAWRSIALYYAAITSEGRGRVVAVPGWRDPIVTYRLTRRDRDLLGRGLARLALVLLEAGARAIYPAFHGAPIVRARRDLAALTGTFAARDASLMTVHLCSTVPMGGDGRGSADCSGRLHGTANVYVNDASLLPDAPGVNPQASVMAIAIRNARRFLADRRSRGRR
jgi:choline dehydrogenase-like flavoprotein